jgi:four helix bundle protein
LHKFCEFYKKIYLLSSKIPKKDKFGIYVRIENFCLDIIILITEAALQARGNKFLLLNSARIKIETLKRLIRITNELKIVENKKYIELESELQEISKMINGWIKYLT